jgi:hypothetical protein
MKSQSKLIVLFALILFTGQSIITAQESNPSSLSKNYISLEVGGSGGAYSFNYGRTVFKNKNWQMEANIGFSVMPVLLYDTYKFYPTIPFGVSVLYGSGNHRLKLGIQNTLYSGYVYVNPKQSEYRNGALISKPEYQSKFHESILPVIGYQYQISSHYFVNVVFTPLVFDNGFTFTPWGGIGFGLSF